MAGNKGQEADQRIRTKQRLVAGVVVGRDHLARGIVAVLDRTFAQAVPPKLLVLPAEPVEVVFDDLAVAVGAVRNVDYRFLTPFPSPAGTGLVSLQQTLIAGGINLDGWLLNEATGVSDDGLTIVGTGTHNGVQQAFVATIPEPSTVVLAVFAVAGLVSFGRSTSRRCR
jgi:hypothetical protein